MKNSQENINVLGMEVENGITPRTENGSKIFQTSRVLFPVRNRTSEDYPLNGGEKSRSLLKRRHFSSSMLGLTTIFPTRTFTSSIFSLISLI